MEETQEEKKHFCKFCNMRFFSGKALGGHMRGHVAEHSTAREKDLKSIPTMAAADSAAGYGLRENPKKSWKFSDSKTRKSSNLCQVCGKGFHSVRALSAHSRAHSGRGAGKENICRECGKGFFSAKGLFGHMQCHSQRSRVSRQLDNEAVGPVRKKRSKRARYRAAATPFSCLHSSSFVLEFDGGERDVEEAVLSLLMLSRGVRDWGDVERVTEFNDGGNPCVFGPKLGEENEKISDNGGKSFVLNRDGVVKKKRKRSDSCVADTGLAVFDRKMSGSGDLDYGSDSGDEMDYKASLEGLLKEGKAKLDYESAFQLGETIHENEFVKLNAADLENVLLSESEEDGADSESLESSVSKKAGSDDAYDHPCGANGSSLVLSCADGHKWLDTPQETGKCTCRSWKKGVHSHWALGGRQASSHKFGSPPEIHSHHDSIPAEHEMVEKLESNESSGEQEANYSNVTGFGLKKRGHECSVCFKSFRSGQALGGHKRAHFFDNIVQQHNIVTRQEHPDISSNFDLNLRTSMDEEEANDASKPLLITDSRLLDPLSGLISN